MRLSKYVLIFLPIIELILFIEVGAFMGSLNVILSIIISMFLGYYLIKQKLRTIRLGLFNPNNFTNLYAEYSSSVYTLLGGFLLIIPGYLTDLLGLISFLPFIRPKIHSYVDNRYGGKSNKNNIIDGEYRDND